VPLPEQVLHGCAQGAHWWKNMSTGGLSGVRSAPPTNRNEPVVQQYQAALYSDGARSPAKQRWHTLPALQALPSTVRLTRCPIRYSGNGGGGGRYQGAHLCDREQPGAATDRYCQGARKLPVRRSGAGRPVGVQARSRCNQIDTSVWSYICVCARLLVCRAALRHGGGGKPSGFNNDGGGEGAKVLLRRAATMCPDFYLASRRMRAVHEVRPPAATSHRCHL
jgi:hypothetical protein